VFSIHGTGVSSGIVIARARVIRTRSGDIPRYHLVVKQVDYELAKLDRAIAQVKVELNTLIVKLPATAPLEASALLQVHAMILDDQLLIGAARDAVTTQLWNAEWAISSQAKVLASQFEEFEDEYLRGRGQDVLQVTERVVRNMLVERETENAQLIGGMPTSTTSESDEPAIYVANDFAPADMLSIKQACGFLIDLGGTTSHSAILARSMNVPAIVGMGHGSTLIRDDDWLIVDGDDGVVIVAPDEAILTDYRHRQAAAQLAKTKLQRLVRVPAVTLDGVTVSLNANIELPEEATLALAQGAQGIGLFRSEFLFLNRKHLPGEDEQFEAYRHAVVEMRGLPVTIRTLDVGADKALDAYAVQSPVAVSPNPALGLRAIRYCLSEPELFAKQLRAILRASAFGSVRMLIPMLAQSREIDQTLMAIESAKNQLREKNIKFDEAMPVGGMIEIPAAALTADMFARRLDFLSIGTNDLVQYTLAIDRADHSVASLYDPLHPAVLRLIEMTIRACKAAGKPVAVCGEIAGDPNLTRLLLGMGLTELSMHPASLLKVKQEVLLSDVRLLKPKATKLLNTDDPQRILVGLQRLRDRGAK
jgi:phosphoenolpyruvate-protein phosphotransferase (PTS system enzyme I)